MGLQTTLQRAAKTAIDVFDDFKSSASHTQKTSATYNPTTGVVGGTSTTYTLNGILTTTVKERESGDAMLVERPQFLVAGLNVSVVPKTQEQLVINSSDYNIEKVELDPAGALYIFHLEKV